MVVGEPNRVEEEGWLVLAVRSPGKNWTCLAALGLA